MRDKGLIVDVGLFVLILGINILLSINDFSILGAICSLSGVLCVLLVARGKIINFLFGTIQVSLYILISWQQQFYGEVMLNLFYYLPINLFGYFIWKKNMNKSGEVNAKTLTKKQQIMLFIISSCVIATYGLFLNSLGGESPFLDSTSTTLSVIAQLLMLAMFVEQWVLWIAVNVVSVLMWFFVYQNDPTNIQALQMMAMWFVYLLNAINGYIRWRALATQEDCLIEDENIIQSLA
ncbi:MAG: hypothetical protein ATN36_01485 [Epulopiscium sp. Nele67-Bin005]|nr:MAG: hypothetical protein ATN36_01485 [Epulopiscium sp. Nele67-Bin005]